MTWVFLKMLLNSHSLFFCLSDTANVSIRMSDDRYGYLCYRPGSDPTNLVFQGTTPCSIPTCFTTLYSYFYSLRGYSLCMSLITQSNEQIVLKPYNVTFPCVPFIYDYANRQLRRLGTTEYLIPYADAGLNVPGLGSLIPSIQTELLPC